MRRVLRQITSRLQCRPAGNPAEDRLTADKWHEVLVRPGTKEQVIARVRSGQMSDWCRFLVGITAPGENVLEIASGTGELSLVLAMLGRRVTLTDLSSESLRFSEECAAELGLTITTLQADVLKGLPFRDDSFDFSWSSGLLEHFPPESRQAILKEQARITRWRVVSLVPNSACLAYRVGKADQEARGVWPYGMETPLATQRDDFAVAGLMVTQESTVGAKHAISFLRRRHPLFRGLNRWIQEQPEASLLDCRQGYLLATVGTKSKGPGQ